MIKYITAAKEAEAFQIIEKSKFIAYIRPVESREEAEVFFQKIRTLHKDATHNVPALILGEKQEIMWSSDDGEPGGTSGTPILQMLANEGLTNVAVMVTRYFGGIKLGTGGLVRAYSGTAKMALDAAGKKEVRDYKQLCVSVPYRFLSSVQKNAAVFKYEIDNIVYEDDVKITLKFEPEFENNILEMLSDISLGNLKIIS